ncbi:MAG: ABC transporter ATP-binding protein/permease [Oscillospiraceae bacterium]|nr:ABC transporter ATP-binding protein/permease [Oscillospiraceae bacterium]
MFKKLLGCIRDNKKHTILTPLFMVGEVGLECTLPMITGQLINAIKNGADIGLILRYGALLVLMAMGSMSCGILSGWFAASAGAGFARNLRHDLFARIQSFSFSNIDKFSTSSLVTRLTTDVTNVQMAFMMIIRTAVRSPLMLVFAITMSIRMGGTIALIFLVTVPILGFGLFYIARKAMPMFKAVFKKYDKLNNSVQENVKGMRVVKSFVREDYEQKKFADASEDVRNDFTRVEKLLAINNPLMLLAMYICMIAIPLLTAKVIISSGGSAMDVGALSTLITYSMQILMSLMMVSMIFVMITISGEAARRIVEVLDTEPTLKNPSAPVTEVADGSIDFENVSFKYNPDAAAYALADVNLHIPSGATVGILGGTGSAKTTLIQLISRLYDVSEGSVKVGGVDVQDYDMEVLRNKVAVVLQKNVLFSGTVAENLRWGDPNASEEEMIQACRQAQAHDFIIAHPEGYDRYIEQGGANVSGGQKQRLCIARALLKKPKILILDDSTSAVDTQTDAKIRKAFREELPDITKLIIAQRVASVQDADIILVMENGRVAAQGTHEELLASNEIYREVYTSQTKGGEEDA